jgi:parallel beta-helix repeat protein
MNFTNLEFRKFILVPLVVFLILAISSALAISVSAEPGTLHVDDDGICSGNLPCFTSIQDAIIAANAGDTVLDYAGTYYEQLAIDKPLSVLAEDLDTTILNAGDTGDPWTINADDVTIGVAEATLAEAAAQVTAASPTNYVDDDGICGGNSPCYTTIQAAVNAAALYDYVFVYAGTYSEHVTISKALTLEGEDREVVIVDGSGLGRVIYVTANNVTIRGLTVTNGQDGIYLIPNWRIHHVTIDDVVVSDNTHIGIEAGHSNSWGAYHTVKDCVLSGNGGWGLYAHQFSRSLIENCEVFGNGAGLDPAWGQSTLVTGNLVYNNTGFGIWFDSMRYSVAENNRAWRNGGGVGLGYVGHHNIVRDNAICTNLNGIHANYPYFRYNRVYHNDLEANTTQAWDLHANYWDNGYPSGGNYWADYTGVDSDMDGIGDTPYTFTGGQDNYPLMKPTIFAAPEVTAFAAPTAPVQVNTPVEVLATFSDPDSYFSHTGEWDWGDDTTSPAVVDETNQTMTGTHTYTVPGVYTVSLTLDDLCGPSGAATYEYVVVYDPNGGFVTGGGWIWSEAGWCQLDEVCAGAEGKANFGFVSKYKKGATVPTGNTEFNFSAGGLNFHSDTYEFLVINQGGTNAQFKGSGTINGEGDYYFMLWAGDDDPDTFRIKIWWQEGDTEYVVYDNGFDQAISGGSIVIHKAKK